MMQQNFALHKETFDRLHGASGSVLSQTLVPENGSHRTNVKLYGADGKRLEEYYKWQFVYAVTHSGKWPKDHIGVEVNFPKGSASSAALELDCALFDDPSWIDHYRSYQKDRTLEDLAWLSEHLLAVVEFKRGADDVAKTFTKQLKPAMREKDPSDAPVVGVYYNSDRMWIFHRRAGKYLRYDESKNSKGVDSSTGDLNLHLPDPYFFLPSLADIASSKPHAGANRSAMTVDGLQKITSISTVQVQDALSAVLRVMDKNGLVNQRGYAILIQIFAAKIFDERRSSQAKSALRFYVMEEERNFTSLKDESVGEFVARLETLCADATAQYPTVLSRAEVKWKEASHVRVVAAIVAAFQDFTFTMSANTDLYQLVFYKFASAFTRAESAQFLTPLPVIDFVVSLVNPQPWETVIDPCCGISDFLAVAFSKVNADGDAAEGKNFFGADVDPDMVTLATLNMLLNGDGEATVRHVNDLGSLEHKFIEGTSTEMDVLVPKANVSGNWDNRPDNVKLRKFDVVLTNPPFGDDRAFRPSTGHEKAIASCYKTWDIAGGTKLDLGVMFLENTVRLLKPGGRFGIVLSNSIASVNRWEKVREWLLTEVRVVGLFDLPSDVFAETGVNTTIIVGYKPDTGEALDRLIESDYEVFVREIENVGYEKRTSKRVTYFKPNYQIDLQTLEVATDHNGVPLLKEDFTSAVADFGQWTLSQESALQQAFGRLPDPATAISQGLGAP